MTRERRSQRPARVKTPPPQKSVSPTDASYHVRAEMFAGPLPPPEVLHRYNQVAPNAADRIIAMAERQEQHRQQLERIVIAGDARRADRGLYAGTFVVSLAIIAGFILVVLGHDWAGGVFVGLGLTSLAGVFVYGTQSRRSERKERRAEQAESEARIATDGRPRKVG